MKKIIIANAPINNGNRGCVALSVTTMYLIDQILSEDKIEYKFYLPDSGYLKNEHHSYSILDKEIEYYSCGYPFAFSVKEMVKLWIYPQFAKENVLIFKNADFILDLGQGDSFADIYGKDRFNLIDKIHRIAYILKKPLCLLPQTIGPFENKSIKKNGIKSIIRSNMVMTRDKMSFDYVVVNAPSQKNVSEYIDIAFFMPYKKCSFDDNYIHVGLNISALLWNGGYTRNNQFSLNVDYKEIIRMIIIHFLKKEHVKLHLISHVVHGERDIENDYAISYDLFNEFNDSNLVLAPLFFSPIDAKSYISGMNFFIGSRMHATIAAFSSNVPVFPLAYSRKFNGLFLDTLQYPYMGDLKVQSIREILLSIDNSYNIKNQLYDIIFDRMMSIVKVREEQLKKDIKRFLEKK